MRFAREWRRAMRRRKLRRMGRECHNGAVMSSVKSSSPRPQPVFSQDWRFLMVLFSAGTFLELSAWGHLQAFTPLYLKNELGVSPADIPRWTGILAASSLIIAVPLSPFWGVLADRYSRKAIIIRAQLVEAFAFALAAMCGDVWQFLAVRLLLGFSFGNIAIVMATQSIATPDRSVGTAVGVIQMCHTIATSMGPLLGSVIINTLGMRAMFAVDAGLTLAAALLMLLVFKEPDYHDRTTPMFAKVKVVFKQVATVPPIRWNFLAWFLIYAGIGAMDPFIPVLVDGLAGGADSATLIGTLLAAYGLLMGVATPIAGRLADRLGAERMFLLAAPGLALISVGIGMAWSIPMLAVLVMLRAIPQASTAVVLYSHLAKVVPVRDRGLVVSLTPMPRNIAWFVGPGLAAAATGFGLSGVFFVAAALFGSAGIVAVLMSRASKPARRDSPKRD
jgi:DHA1 family multidrug resistance protein-like MFS transporter